MAGRLRGDLIISFGTFEINKTPVPSDTPLCLLPPSCYIAPPSLEEEEPTSLKPDRKGVSKRRKGGIRHPSDATPSWKENGERSFALFRRRLIIFRFEEKEKSRKKFVSFRTRERRERREGSPGRGDAVRSDESNGDI